MQEGVDTTNPESFAAAASSNSSAQYADAARSIMVAIAANRSTNVSAAVGSVVLAAYDTNNTQVAFLHLCTVWLDFENESRPVQHTSCIVILKFQHSGKRSHTKAGPLVDVAQRGVHGLPQF